MFSFCSFPLIHNDLSMSMDFLSYLCYLSPYFSSQSSFIFSYSYGLPILLLLLLFILLLLLLFAATRDGSDVRLPQELDAYGEDSVAIGR